MRVMTRHGFNCPHCGKSQWVDLPTNACLELTTVKMPCSLCGKDMVIDLKPAPLAPPVLPSKPTQKPAAKEKKVGKWISALLILAAAALAAWTIFWGICKLAN